MYYGNSTATDGQAATSVWNSSYVGVYHLKETGTNPTVSDSTSNANNSTSQTWTPTTSGEINGAGSFNGTTQKVSVPSSSSNNLTGSLTLSAWVFPKDVTTTFRSIVGKEDWTNAKGYYLGLNPDVNGGVYFGFNKGGNEIDSNANAVTLNTWYKITGVYDGSGLKIYVNGSLIKSGGSATAPVANTNPLTLAYVLSAVDNYTNVNIDEVRISNSARSAAWIAAEYKTEVDTFNTFASEEQEYPSSGTLTSSIFDTTQQSDWGTLTYSATTPTNTSVAVYVRSSNNSDMTGATAFASCTAISNNGNINSGNCTSNGQRYVQYQISLATTDTTVTPTLTSISIPFTFSNATALNAVSLDNALANVYSTSERASFQWNAPDTTLSGLASYSISVDNGDTGSFTINNIPTSGSKDLETSKYSVHFEHFTDGDPSNNTITLTTKSSSDWKSTENDGKLREGKRNIGITAYGNSGNTRSLSQTLFVDLTRGTIAITQINDTKLTQTPTKPLGTTARKPQIFGRITDPLAGDVSSTRNNQVASGPKQVEVKLEKRNSLGSWDVHTLSTIQTPETFFSDTNRKIGDNTVNTASKYAIFSFTPEENLSYGDYRVTITGKDNAGNQSQPVSFSLTIAPFNQIVPAKEQKVIEQTIEEEFPQAKPEEKQQLKEELNVVREVTPTPPGRISAVQTMLPKVAGSVQGAYWTSVDTAKSLGTGAWQMITSVFYSGRNTMTVLADGLQRYKQFVDASNQATNKYASEKLHDGAGFLASTYTTIARQAPGIAADGLLAFGNGFSRAGNTIVTIINATVSTTIATSSTVTRFVSGTSSSLVSSLSAAGIVMERQVHEVTNPLVSNTGKTIHHLKVNLLATGEIWFDRNPTNITYVQVTEVGKDYAVITWKTTHYTTNNKVNYGETLSYGHDTLDLERERFHRITIRPLKPETKYYFEVMSQNKNYVYDAHHEFTTGSPE